MGRRRQARENALHSLYLFEAGLLAPAAFHAPNHSVTDEKTKDFAKRLFEGTLGVREELDQALRRIATNWDIARMAAVDRNVLRLAAFELLHCPETPPNVIINEAIEIVKKFSTEDSSRFVNGVLDKLKDLRGRREPAPAGHLPPPAVPGVAPEGRKGSPGAAGPVPPAAAPEEGSPPP